MKLFEENIAINLRDLDLGNGFLAMTSTSTKERIDKLDFIKIKNCLQKTLSRK